MKRTVPVALFLGLVLLAAGLATANEGLRRADAHQHSVAQGRLALESGDLFLMLEIPGVNLVGFEHPPRDEAQQQALADALARLREGNWLALPGEAECDTVREVEVTGFDPGTESGQGDHDHGHPHDHDSSHDHEHDSAHEHAEFRISVSAECSADSPDWLELRLFDGWPDNRLIRVDAVTGSRQFRVELTADEPRIELR